MRLYVFIEGICIFLGFDPCIYVTVLYVRTIDARKEKKKQLYVVKLSHRILNISLIIQVVVSSDSHRCLHVDFLKLW